MNQMTIPDRLSDHETRIQLLEAHNQAPRKPWWASKGVVGPLVSGVATVALVVGYIAAWPADALAALAAVAGGGSITGVIGRITAKAQITSLLVAVLAVGLLATPESAQAMKWRVSDCLLPDGQIIAVPRASCAMYHQSFAIQESSDAYRAVSDRLALIEPAACSPQSMTDTEYALCLMREQTHARDVVDLRRAMGDPLEMQARREDREQRDREHRREMWLRVPRLVLDIQTAIDPPRSRDHGPTYVAGDVFNVRGSGSGRGGGPESGGSSGSGVSISKSGDNAMAVNHRGNQQTGFFSSGMDQDNRREGTEFQPAAAEGSSATFAPAPDNRDQSTFGLGL